LVLSGGLDLAVLASTEGFLGIGPPPFLLKVVSPMSVMKLIVMHSWNGFLGHIQKMTSSLAKFRDFDIVPYPGMGLGSIVENCSDLQIREF